MILLLIALIVYLILFNNETFIDNYYDRMRMYYLCNYGKYGPYSEACKRFLGWHYLPFYTQHTRVINPYMGLRDMYKKKYTISNIGYISNNDDMYPVSSYVDMYNKYRYYLETSKPNTWDASILNKRTLIHSGRELHDGDKLTYKNKEYTFTRSNDERIFYNWKPYGTLIHNITGDILPFYEYQIGNKHYYSTVTDKGIRIVIENNEKELYDDDKVNISTLGMYTISVNKIDEPSLFYYTN